MKVTVLKRDGKKEVINRVEVGIVQAARRTDNNQLGGWHPAAENMLCCRLPNAERRVEDDGL